MIIEVLDVGHGFSALVITDSGRVLLFDCGRKENFSPTSFLRTKRITEINDFVVTNYDQDHLSDLTSLRSSFKINTLWRNPTISPSNLKSIKEEAGPLTNEMRSMIDMLSHYTGGIDDSASAESEVEWVHFYNNYPTDFTDTNNCSFVTFLHYRNIHMLIPGDLEKAGWQRLLESSLFRQQLDTVNIFITSHHGRENGYCSEVFSETRCAPEIFIISDDSIQYGTQEHSLYAQHATGVNINGQNRKVLTTRNDGTITVQQTAQSGATIDTLTAAFNRMRQGR